MIVEEFGGFYAVTKSDTDDLPGNVVAIYVGGTGSVVADDCNGHTSVTFTAVPVGTTLRGKFKRVRTGSTATLMVAITSPATIG